LGFEISEQAGFLLSIPIERVNNQNAIKTSHCSESIIHGLKNESPVLQFEEPNIKLEGSFFDLARKSSAATFESSTLVVQTLTWASHY
jgi:hypothetical protein